MGRKMMPCPLCGELSKAITEQDIAAFCDPPAFRKVGRGIVAMQVYICSGCDAFITGYLDTTSRYAPKYCPNCGVKLGDTND